MRDQPRGCGLSATFDAGTYTYTYTSRSRTRPASSLTRHGKLSPALTLVAACALPLQLALRHWSRERVRSTTTAVREQSSHVAQFLMETLSSAKGVQAAAA